VKIVVIGGTGTIGTAVSDALASRHEVVRVSRKGPVKADIEETASLKKLFELVKDVDAVVNCAGSAAFKPLAQLTDADFQLSSKSKLMGQVSLVRIAMNYVKDGGSITLTGGVLAHEPMRGGAAISMVNAGLEGFVTGAAIEMPRGIRLNLVSPPWISETLAALKMDPSGGIPAPACAKAYVAASTKARRLTPASSLDEGLSSTRFSVKSIQLIDAGRNCTYGQRRSDPFHRQARKFSDQCTSARSCAMP
jgi:NAD(P)-dependent dehydrogenase (short-subunit alcohol dehydrogenase family)